MLSQPLDVQSPTKKMIAKESNKKKIIHEAKK